jgi:hypothetical protein
MYNNNTIMSSIYTKSDVRYTNYLPTHQVYNTNVLDRSQVVMSAPSSHVNMHNSHSSTDLSRWSNHNTYITEHVSNIHYGFVPPYSLAEPASHCTPKIHMPMSNCYSRTDIKASVDFGRSLYTIPDSIRMKITPNMVLAPPIAFSVFHSASPIYSRVEKSSTNTPSPGINGSDFNKDNNIKTTYDGLMEEDCKALEAYRAKVDELFFSCYEVMRQGLVQKDVAPIVIRKAEATPEVRSNPSLSLDDVQSMINFTLERQVKNNDELTRRLIEEQDRKKLVDSNVNPFSSSSSSYAVNFVQTNPQPSGTSAGGTSQPNPSTQPMNHFYNRMTIDGSTPANVMLKVEITVKQNNSSDDFQSSDCISIL